MHALLGGEKRDRVEVYASLLAYGGNLEHVKRNTARALERGYRQIKLHEKTTEAVAAARETTGPGHSDHGRHQLRLAAAMRDDAVMAMKPYDPLWVEEPIWPPEDVDALGSCARRPACRSRRARTRPARSISAGWWRPAIDYLQPSAVKNGAHRAMGDRPQGREGRRDLRAALALLRAGLSGDAAHPRGARKEVALERFFSDLALTCLCEERADRERRVDVPDMPGPRAPIRTKS